MDSSLKPKKRNIPKKIREMSKEMLQETLKKKKECNAKALQIVQKLCEVCVDESWFLKNLEFINQCHFDDITIERAISHMCGYPLCNQQLKNVPTQQYHISTRYNKVFDITERKNFCSNCCYKSAIHIKKQLFTSPLWFRDQEIIPEFTVLKSPKSSLGEEVVFLPDKIKPEPDDRIKTNAFKNADILNQNIEDLQQKCSYLKIDNSQKTYNEAVKNDEVYIFNKKEEKISVGIKIFEKSSYSEVKKQEKNVNNKNGQTNDQDPKETGISTGYELQNLKKTKSKNEKKSSDTISKVEKSIFEWFSLDTYIFLYGEEKLRELFSDKIDEIKQLLNSKLSVAGCSDRIDRMIQLYGLLDTDSYFNKEIKTNLKPLPDYSTLKEEKNTVEIKVRAFYQGQLEMKETPAKNAKEKEIIPDSEVIYLPLIDAHAQIPHRRKILLDKLDKVLCNLINILDSDSALQMNEVKHLVATFMLSAHNITFKPIEWYLVGIIILKLLSIKDKQLDSAITKECSETQILLILANFNLQKDYLDSLVSRLTNSENLMKKLNESYS